MPNATRAIMAIKTILFIAAIVCESVVWPLLSSTYELVERNQQNLSLDSAYRGSTNRACPQQNKQHFTISRHVSPRAGFLFHAALRFFEIA